MKKYEKTNTRVTNEKREREEKHSSDTVKTNIPHKMHIETDVQVFIVGEFTDNDLEVQW